MPLNELGKALVDYGRHKLAVATGQKGVPLPDGIRWADYEGLLGPRRPRETQLSCIFSRVLGLDGGKPRIAYYAAQELMLDRETLFPQATLDEAGKRTRWKELGERFEGEYEELRKRLPVDDPCSFDAFYYLFYRWAWTLPCDYGEPGVSLFEQWKAITALAVASRGSAVPAKEMALVGGDIPGIQDFVYTITSKGAAKGLRGRSLFIQLLGDAVVRRLLGELGLSLANVVYNAGGNFLLLAPRDAKETVDHVRNQVNRRLVEAFQGEAALVLESLAVQPAQLFAPGEFGRVRGEFAAQLALAKGRALYDVARGKDGWQDVFAPQGKGSKSSCVVCHVEVDESNSVEVGGAEVAEETVGTARPEPARICCLCDSFARLARDVAHEHLWMNVKPARIKRDSRIEGKGGWQQVLARVSGLEYEFTHETPRDVTWALAINQPPFLTALGCGFRLLANVAPVVTRQELQDLEHDEEFPSDEMPHEGDIRSFELLARAARTKGALPRVGVLRMDADGLGAAFSDGMPDMTLPALSGMSAAMERFFNGHLNVLAKKQSENDLYVIYSGGDDLFIVGAWPHLPELAESIRDGFNAYTGGHPALSLSGGVTLEGARFPLYRAAERAGAAEARAKRYARPDGRQKDALCFLDTVVPWEDWPLVRQERDRLLWLIGETDNTRNDKRLPRGLLHLLQSIHSLHRSDLQQARRRARKHKRPLPHARMFLGRWMWMQVYHLARLAERSRKDLPDAPQRITELQKSILDESTVCYSGLAARWTEYLTRKEKG